MSKPSVRIFQQSLIVILSLSYNKWKEKITKLNKVTKFWKFFNFSASINGTFRLAAYYCDAICINQNNLLRKHIWYITLELMLSCTLSLVLSLVNKPFLSVNKNKTENKQSIKLSDKLRLVSYTLINVRKYLKSLDLINWNSIVIIPIISFYRFSFNFLNNLRI